MKVNICGLHYNVKEVENRFDINLNKGQINFGKLEILINNDLPIPLKEETLCHEMVHGILTHIGHDELSDNEQFVQALGNAIYQGFSIKEINYKEQEQ